MDSILFETFLLLLALLWTSARSEPTRPEQVDCATQELEELDELFLFEGESLWFILDEFDQDNTFTWFWNSSQDILQLSSEETNSVHAHGPALFVLNITSGSSGCFLAWEEDSEGSVIEHYVRVSVVPEDSPKRLYTVEDSDSTIFIFCPRHVRDTCHLNGTLSWYKGSALLAGQHKEHLQVQASAEAQGRYDCVCTWTHQHQLYRTVGSRLLRIKEQSVPLSVRILAPTEEVQLADTGASLLLNCTVFCGTDLPPEQCVARWHAENSDLNSEGYNQSSHVEPNSSKQTIVTGTLSFRRVLPAHFREKFYCVGTRRYGDSVSITVHLKPRPSVASLAAAGTCVFLLFVLMAVMVKCFAVDLVLLFRRLFPFRLEDAGLKMFDAYVVYQLHSQDKLIEEALARFVSQDLPHVLEDKCGYKLFIHGRDDLPGEDHVELVEERMRKSRRLMVILTPGSGSEVTDTYQLPEGYDWQVGLHQALVHRDLSVILIQLGNTSPREYSHLPLALQHLIQRGAPISVEPNSSKQTIVTGTLSIRRVLPAHFREKFYCVGTRRYGDSVSITVHLKPRPSVASLAAAGTCVFLLFVLMAVMVKCFAVDLVLLFRRLFPFRLEDAGLKMFDAYVVYQLHSQDKLIEEALARFVSQDLPHVLEDKCGYKLFIHGRDDLPGEDHVELVEERMRKSRRLMVILTPGSGSEVTDTYQLPEGYDWQVGLHQALVHRDLSVILIQLGNTSPREYSHLPLALQHLIQRGAPIRWPQEQCTTCVNSRFWKNVRYLMPATPVTTYDMSTL